MTLFQSQIKLRQLCLNFSQQKLFSLSRRQSSSVPLLQVERSIFSASEQDFTVALTPDRRLFLVALVSRSW